mmetsp:Transcript_50918/g.168596  ORF Transcript_50918/g.168596 Transcript_50918/m.168596 type:complete len:233 (-) Transcript_50918:31-729(-)|eukprot:CAMPEP_0196686300 /NCGR_PEP_ID=MMETSP1090-20130531/12351_1 /TAXON_ID=37098 /ORGANISM="Isochrysis sp, Strain CCMP1244" /LENGTH=232 /DNA_ID=CAMNT_0042024885 /DNA_START=134 /DNA_END=832 /DNA_ORIENTATION=-
MPNRPEGAQDAGRPQRKTPNPAGVAARSHASKDDAAVACVEQLERSLAGDVRVREHADGAKHGEPAVVELAELVGVPGRCRLPLGGAEEVARLVVGPPAVEDAEDLHEADEEEDLQQAQLGHLRDCEERVARELAAEEGVELVGGDHAGAREHGDSAVLQLRLAELGHRLGRRVLGEAERVKVAQRLAVAHHPVDLANWLGGERLQLRSAQGGAALDERQRQGGSGGEHLFG